MCKIENKKNIKVCSYCPGKKYRDLILTILGYGLSHGICENCDIEILPFDLK